MRHVAPVIPVSPKLFRHFAALTVVLTSGLAMFADGENREALAETVDRHQAKIAAQQAEREKLGNHRVIGKPKAVAAASNNDAPIDEGAPSGGSGYNPSPSGGSDAGEYAWRAAEAPKAPASANLPNPPAVDPNGNPIGGASPKLDTRRSSPGKKADKRPARASKLQVDALLAASRTRSGQTGTGSGGDFEEDE